MKDLLNRGVKTIDFVREERLRIVRTGTKMTRKTARSFVHYFKLEYNLLNVNVSHL